MFYITFLERKLERIRCRFSFNSVFISFSVFYLYGDTKTVET
jgi:hypothetical protein